jgi:predicted transport protein
MSDLKLFRLSEGLASTLTASSAALEKDLQKLIEENMGTIFGVEFLQSEYVTGKVHGGRIDSLGIDENGLPVILEYKRHQNENVINQGLFYLDWLMDHRGEFQLLVQQKLGPERAGSIDWSEPRLICVANSFTRYDEHAVKQIDRNVQLVRYQYFGDDLLAVELITTTEKSTSNTTAMASTGSTAAPHMPFTGTGQSQMSEGSYSEKTVTEKLHQATPALRSLYEQVEEFAHSLGEDVIKKINKNYVAFRRLKNFACVEVHPQTGNLLIHLKLDPKAFKEEKGFLRDMTGIGHYGTGDVELRIADTSRWEQVTSMINQAYEEN